MVMDPDKILKFLTENIADFFEVMARTLVRPVAHFRPISASVAPASLATEEDQPQSRWFDPKLFAFAGVSIIVGTLINGLIPGRRQGPELFATVVVVLVVWFAYSTGVYFLCKVLRGKGTYADTMAVSIQLLATLFVVASSLTLVLATVAQLNFIKLFLEDVPFLGFLLEQPTFLFFGIDAILLGVYLPLALKHIHGFGWIRQLCVGVIPFITMWGGVLFYISHSLVFAE